MATLVASTAIVLVLVDRAGLPALAVWLPLTLAILTAHYLGMKHWAFAGRAVSTASRLIVNADDFGLADAVNRGIVEALRPRHRDLDVAHGDGC